MCFLEAGKPWVNLSSLIFYGNVHSWFVSLGFQDGDTVVVPRSQTSVVGGGTNHGTTMGNALADDQSKT